MNRDDSLHLHVARWVVPVASPPLEYGAVVTFGGRIVDVGPARELRSRYHGSLHDHGERILCPGLINAHSHLELSVLRLRLTPSGSFVGWIRALIAAKEGAEEGGAAEAARKSVHEMAESGILAVGDVGNKTMIPTISSGMEQEWPLRGIFFHEKVCPLPTPEDLDFSSADLFSQGPAEQNFPACLGMRYSVSAHAPYSVGPGLLQAIKIWDRTHGLPFSIHVAESEEETEFLRWGSGPLRDFLVERGHGPPKFSPRAASPVQYLDQLGVLDRDTLCVHCVHLDERDVDALVRTGASVCLCPRSNMFLGVGIPPVAALHRAGVTLALGTDSLASNDRLSVFAEMASLARLVPELSPDAVLRAATLGGAVALGAGRQLGSLEPGKTARFLSVAGPVAYSKEVTECLVHAGPAGPVDLCWIDDGD